MAQHLVHLQQSRVTTTVAGGDEQAGNITIDPEFVVLQGSQVKANAVGGPGGNITIRAEVFLADPASAVTASSLRNIDGEINIQAPVTNLSGIVAPLPQNFMAAAALLRDQCAARRREGTSSSLVVRERDGIPATPEGTLPSHRYEREADAHQTPSATPRASRHSGRQADTAGEPRATKWSAARAVNAWYLPCTP
jgi:large exoprotein involved in heme utilization and adhesion